MRVFQIIIILSIFSCSTSAIISREKRDEEDLYSPDRLGLIFPYKVYPQKISDQPSLLRSIESYIQESNADYVPTGLEELKDALSDPDSRHELIKKLDAAIAQRPYKRKANKKAQRDLRPCGNNTDIKIGIVDCRHSKKSGLILAQRSQDLFETYYDPATKLLWSDRFPFKMNHYRAQMVCAKSAIFTDLKWRLPTKEEFFKLQRRGTIVDLPHMAYYFWTADIDPNFTDYAFVYSGPHGIGTDTHRDYYDDIISVRCVANVP